MRGLAKNMFSPADEWCLPAPFLIKPEERELVVDSGASMHMLSKEDLNSAELEAVRVSKSPTTVVAANGEVQTEDETTVYVKELDLFVTVKASPRYSGRSLCANIREIPMSGPMVRNHNSSKMSDE